MNNLNLGIYIALPLLLVLVILQAAFVSYASIASVTVQIVPIFLIAWALARTLSEAIIGAFVGGLAIDLLSIGPTGMTVLALSIAILTIGPLRGFLVSSRFLFPLILAALAMFTFLLVSVLIARMTGYATSWQGLDGILRNVLIHALLTMPMYWLLRGFGRLVRRESRPIEI